MEEVRDLKERLPLPHSTEIREDGGQKRLSERLEHIEIKQVNDLKVTLGLLPYSTEIKDAGDPKTLPKRVKDIKKMPKVEARVCIYRVHDGLRNAENEAHYKPLLVSIGPYHHGNQKFSALMQQHKLLYLNSFLKRSGKCLDECRSTVEENVDSALMCYAGPIRMTRNEFVEMMLLDSCFVIEFLYRLKRKDQEAYRSDPILKDPWMLSQVIRDLLLLENQVPFCLPFQLLSDDTRQSSSKLIEAAKYLATEFLQFKYCKSPSDQPQPHHFLDPVKNFMDKILKYCSPTPHRDHQSHDVERQQPHPRNGNVEYKHFLDLVTNICVPSKKEEKKKKTGTLGRLRLKEQCSIVSEVYESDNVTLFEEEEKKEMLSKSSSAFEVYYESDNVTHFEEEEEEEKERKKKEMVPKSSRAFEVYYESDNVSLFEEEKKKERKKKEMVPKEEETGTLGMPRLEICQPLGAAPAFEVNNSNNGQEKEETGMPCVKELQQGSIAFKVNESDKVTLFDIEFDRRCSWLRRARLKIPRFTVDDNTETLLRNIIAYEQHNFKAEFRYFTDYTHCLDKLINSEEDVTYLRLHKIIDNMLGDDKEVATLINRLGNGIIIDKRKYYYSQVCKEVNHHYGRCWNQFMATLRRKYLNNPWAWISTFAGLLLLILTTTATVVSLINALT